MVDLTEKEIMKASEAIDKALLSTTRENRGEVAFRILSIVRNLNDHIADKIWKDMRPHQRMDINKVASKFGNLPPYQFIARFDKFLRASVSHFTPSEEGAERLMLKYYRFILQLKKALYDRYGIVIINNIDSFLEDLDEQTKDYYYKVAQQIELNKTMPDSHNFDNYYVDKIKPFFVNHEIYYEVVLEPANEKPSKFNRITAFTKCDITTNYCVALSFSDGVIEVFNTHFPITIINDWHVSIRPCEINNFSNLLNINLSISRGNNEYKALMNYLEKNQISLVDILDYEDFDYNMVKRMITSTTKNHHSYIFDVLDKCRSLCISCCDGRNLLRFLLHRMNNRVIKDQLPYSHEKSYAGLNISAKCMPFDRHPYAFNPKKHISNLFDLLDCIPVSGYKQDLLARYIEKNTNQNAILFTPIEELYMFGSPDEIKQLIQQYNISLYSGFRPSCELGIYKDCVYLKGSEVTTLKIIQRLQTLTNSFMDFSDRFSTNSVTTLKTLPERERLDDIAKETILVSMFSKSKVHLIYGAAGTGKTTLINHISKLMSGKRKVYLAKTNPAVENLRRKVTCCDIYDEFITIDRFTKNSWYENRSYDLIVVDECSTVKNDEIINILNRDDAVYVLVGDTYQIEAIGFGNWFSICKNIVPDYCFHDLTTPHRSPDEAIQKVWDEVRNMDDDNVVLEKMVRSDYSHSIDNDIFDRKATDEIILCLNYNGLYGLNNINRLLQLNNPNPAIDIGVWRFKVGDPILFNDSGRFDILYNNLKGKIVDLKDNGTYVYFVVDVEIELRERDILFCDGLDFIESSEGRTQIGFNISRTKPYSSDEEQTTNEHIVPFQIAYAVSIHKAQGLEYDSVKIVIADETEEQITHNIFYTAITRTRKYLTIYWSPEVCNRVLARIRPTNYKKDFYLLKSKNNF